MSVLIEALSLVVPRKVLDARYPGGSDAWLREAQVDCGRTRYAVADRQLAVRSYLDPREARAAAGRLEECGAVATDGTMAVEIVFVDQQYGPALPCPWLKWTRHDGGFTTACVAGVLPDSLVTPEGWSAESSRALKHADIRAEPGRAIPVGKEDGLEIWLDLRTGELVAQLPHQELAQRADAAARAIGYSLNDQGRSANPSGGPDGPIAQAFLRVIESRAWRYSRDENTIMVGLTLPCSRVSVNLTAMLLDEGGQIEVIAKLPNKVPESRRPAAAEFITRANVELAIGCFLLDFVDGEVCFRTAIDTRGGAVGDEMIETLIDVAWHTANRYYDALMRVTYGNAEPKDALSEMVKGEQDGAP
jgi:hypothetical protein